MKQNKIKMMIEEVKYPKIKIVQKTCKITKEQEDFIKQNNINLSKLVRTAINELIDKDKIDYGDKYRRNARTRIRK